MILIEDKGGRVTSVLCFLLLLCYHTSRDALITALPTIALCHLEDDTLPQSNDTTTTKATTPHTSNMVFETSIQTEATFVETEMVPAPVNFLAAHGGGFPIRRKTRSSDDVVMTGDFVNNINDPRTDDESDQLLNYNNILVILSQQKQLDATIDDVRYDNYNSERNLPQLSNHVVSANTRPDNLNKLDAINVTNKDAVADGNEWLPTYDLRNKDSGEVVGGCINYTFGGWFIKEDWSLGVQSSILSSFHWFSVLGLFIGYICTERSPVSEGVLTAASVLQWGTLSLVTELVAQSGFEGFTALRAWQGLVQGATYPCVYRLLEARNLHQRKPLALLFFSPWLGSIFGTVMGARQHWQLPFYLAGGVAILVGVTLIFLKAGDTKPKTPSKWSLVLRRDVVVVAAMHGGCAWVLHTLLIAPTILMTPGDGTSTWVIAVMLASGGVTSQVLEAVVETIVPYRAGPARRHLLTTTIIGLAFTIVSLVMVTTRLTGMVAVGGVLGTVFGVAVTAVGYRHVLEVAPANRRQRALAFVNGAGALGAAFGSVLLPSMTGAQVEGPGGYVSACLLPLSLVIAGVVCVFLFLLFPTTKEEEPGQHGTGEAGVYVVPVNGNAGGGYYNDGLSLRSTNKSFKSARSMLSTATFKTAMSRHRTASFNTVQEDLDEGELHSLPEESSVECRSVVAVREDDVHSIQSVATSYRSTARPSITTRPAQQTFNELIDTTGDRTSAWLHLHHQVDMSGRVVFPQVAAEVQQPLPGLLL